MPDVNIVNNNGQLYIDVDGNGNFDGSVDIAIPDNLAKDIVGILGSSTPMPLATVLEAVEKKYKEAGSEDGAEISEGEKQKLEELQKALDGKIGELTKKRDELQRQISSNSGGNTEGLQTQLGQVKKQLEALQGAKGEVDKKLEAWNKQSGEAQAQKQGEPKGKAAQAVGGGAGSTGPQLPNLPSGGGFGTMSLTIGTPGTPGYFSGKFAVGGGGGWGGGYGFGTGGFDFSAFLASTYNDQAILEGWDALGRGSMEQQKMLMLFFYFARMAMSGDLGAMYRFLQFITYLISHDKAIMNIHMASKLIELETMNRNALKELLNTPTGGAGDLDAQGQFTKQLQLTQSVQSSTATSQKLIAQMMEEMAQVVEVLTSTTKAALEANGRVLQRISMKG